MRVLLTGAAGQIGRTYFEARKDVHNFLLTDILPLQVDEDAAEVRIGDLTDAAFATSLLSGMDAVVHLAGTVDTHSSFDKVMALNVHPTKHLLSAAVEQNVRRFVFASSAQTIEGYPLDVQIKTSDQVRPANFYAAGKIMGEALCAIFSLTHGLETVALRIGAFEEFTDHNLKTARDYSAWLSPRDAIHLIDRALAADVNDPVVVNGISNNRFKRLNIESAREKLGYNPVDDAFARFDIAIEPLVSG